MKASKAAVFSGGSTGRGRASSPCPSTTTTPGVSFGPGVKRSQASVAQQLLARLPPLIFGLRGIEGAEAARHRAIGLLQKRREALGVAPAGAEAARVVARHADQHRDVVEPALAIEI